MYGLTFLANVRKGQTVLIHSASGGVGLAALDLCKYIWADIFVTVGTDAKRIFLEEIDGVSRDRMFSSRSTLFADELMLATGDGGTFIEIGKKDLIDRKNISMEPFDRNCSYRALCLSRKSTCALKWARMELDVELNALEIVGSRTLVTLCEPLKRMG